MRKYLIALWVLCLPALAYAQVYTVERVVDGDTIVVTTSEGKSETVHLIGVHAPEPGPNDKARKDSERIGQDLKTIIEMGNISKDYLKMLLLYNQEVRLEIDVQDRDEHGGLLAYVYQKRINARNVDGKSINCDVGWCIKATDTQGDEWYWYSVNAIITAEGFVMPMAIHPNVKYADLFKKLHEDAIEDKRGFWDEKGPLYESRCTPQMQAVDACPWMEKD